MQFRVVHELVCVNSDSCGLLVCFSFPYLYITSSNFFFSMASLPMSPQIIACDAPLSPLGADHHWDLQQPLFSPLPELNYAYYLPSSPLDSEGSFSSASPVPTSRMLKMSMSPDEAAELCLPTHQVFDIPEDQLSCPSSHSTSAQTNSSVAAIASCGSKRSASPVPGTYKKRSVGERINSKDFIPPDVSGLSKREARLVKNRAAAFLSRQRKREEFECMEVYVTFISTIYPSISLPVLITYPNSYYVVDASANWSKKMPGFCFLPKIVVFRRRTKPNQTNQTRS